MREPPKASSTKLYWKQYSGRGNTPGYGKNDDDDEFKRILKWAIRRKIPKVDMVRLWKILNDCHHSGMISTNPRKMIT